MVQKKPCAVKVHLQVGKEIWEHETPEFQRQVAEEACIRHKKELKEWKANLQPAETPEDFHE